MTSTKGHGPQSPANKGAKISGTPTQSVDSQGGLGGKATCDRSQRLSPGPLECTCTVTGDSTVSAFMAAQPTRGTTPCVVDLHRRCPKDRLQRPFDEGKRNEPRLVAGTSTQPELSTSLQIPDPPSRTAEAMDTGVSEKPLPWNPRVIHLESPRGKRKSCLPTPRRRQQLRQSRETRT